MKRREASSGILAYFSKRTRLECEESNTEPDSASNLETSPRDTESELLTDLQSQSSNQTESQTQ